MGIKYTHHCDQLLDLADFDCFMLQGAYTLLEQPAKAFMETVRKAKRWRVFIAGPFASGILASGSAKGGYFHHSSAPETILEKVRRLETICHKFGIPLPTAALQFPLRNEHVTSVVCGFHEASQVLQAQAWLELETPESFWQELQDTTTLAAS